MAAKRQATERDIDILFRVYRFDLPGRSLQVPLKNRFGQHMRRLSCPFGKSKLRTELIFPAIYRSSPSPCVLASISQPPKPSTCFKMMVIPGNLRAHSREENPLRVLQSARLPVCAS
ncbi:hypothetical protein FOZ60_003470 [Perkinsus olseni]|uniref:Uncharacterized protein n=1 Tax=Perkinsus olseni TaxID=32597 RepID=A0A7J6NXQ2_PEROL|nr:hypothetical protein FOZ60_003470 [Perkinsus olseni]